MCVSNLMQTSRFLFPCVQVSVQLVTPSKSSGCPFGRRSGVFPCATGRSRRMQNPGAPYRRSTPALTYRRFLRRRALSQERRCLRNAPYPRNPLCRFDELQRPVKRGFRTSCQAVATLDAGPFPTYDCTPLKLSCREVSNDEVPIPTSSNVSRSLEKLQGDGFRISRNISRPQGRKAFRPGCGKRGLHHRGSRIQGNPFCA